MTVRGHVRPRRRPALAALPRAPKVTSEREAWTRGPDSVPPGPRRATGETDPQMASKEGLLMRRAALVMLGGTAAAAVAGAAALIVDLRRPQEAVGAMRGRRGSRVNTWMNRPVYRLVAEALELGSDDELLDSAAVGAPPGGAWLGVRFVAGMDRPRRRSLPGSDSPSASPRGPRRSCVATPRHPVGGRTVQRRHRHDAFQFFADPAQALAEMRRKLRPGGRAVVAMRMQLRGGRAPRDPGFSSERPCDVRKVRDRLERRRSWPSRTSP